jgi:GDP-4-dehydro-6-deoxy-D-mannose reductase
MRVVVTGANGFVGPHLIEHLTACGDEVLCLLGPGKPVPAGRVVDLLDANALRGAIAPFAPDALVNLAGMSHVSQSHAQPLEAFRINLMGVVTICAALREVAPKARLLLVGSGEMYGDVAAGTRALESDALAPKSPYAAAKVGAEVAALTFRRSYGLDVVLARPFNHLGRGQRPDFAIPSFARQLEAVRAGNAPPVLAVGNLTPVRDFSHVRDVVGAYRMLLERGAPGEAYNICSGEGRTIGSVLDELIAVSEVDARIEVDPARVRPSDIPNLVGDPSRLRALGWKPRLSLREALADVLAEARLLVSAPS